MCLPDCSWWKQLLAQPLSTLQLPPMRRLPARHVVLGESGRRSMVFPACTRCGVVTKVTKGTCLGVRLVWRLLEPELCSTARTSPFFSVLHLCSACRGQCSGFLSWNQVQWRVESRSILHEHGGMHTDQCDLPCSTKCSALMPHLHLHGGVIMLLQCSCRAQ